MKGRSRVVSVTQQDYLSAYRCSNVERFEGLPPPMPEKKHIDRWQLPTNYGITINHPYSFILLHLKAPNTKNIINIHIPEVCIFHNNIPFDIIYNDNGFIKGLKDSGHIGLSTVYSFFLNKSKANHLYKQEQCIACFEDEEYLLLSDTDLFINCRRLPTDPFFSKLFYITNRIHIVEPRIIVHFNGSKDYQFRGNAVQNLLGHKKDHDLWKQLGRSDYLQYICQKISLFLQLEHNIRIKTADFVFARTASNQFYFVDVLSLQFDNFTAALIRRQSRLDRQQIKLAQKIIISQQKYSRLKIHEQRPQVRLLTEEMNNNFYTTAKKLQVKLNHSSMNQTKKNEEAFNKLFPRYKQKMISTIDSMNIKQLRTKVMTKSKTKTHRKSVIVKGSLPTTEGSTKYGSFQKFRSQIL